MTLSWTDHLVSKVPDAVIVVDQDTLLHYANPAAERLFGWRVEDRIGRESLDLIHPDDLEFALLAVETVMEKEVGSPIEVRMMTATGWKLVELVGSPYGEPDIPDGIVLSLRDLTDRRRWEVARDDVALFRSLMQNAASVTMLVEPSGIIAASSAAMPRVLGHDPADVSGRPLVDLVVPEDQPRFLAALADACQPTGPKEIRRVNIDVGLRRRDGGTVSFQLTIVDLLDDPTVAGLVVSGQDISELQTARQQLAHAAEHDDLTGLPNRSRLCRELELRLSDDGPRATTIAFVDLDRFKTINDLFGHEAGDEVLVTVSRRLKHVLRGADVVARLGSDEFVVVASVTSEQEAHQLLARLAEALAEPMQLRAGPVQVSASIGSVIAHPGDGVDEVLTEADTAMSESKNRTRGLVEARARPLSERRSLAEDLDHAFTEDQFEVHYQPILDLADARPISVEALARWRHPIRGLLLPDLFLDVVEDTGRIHDLGDFVTRTALRDLRDFEAFSGPDLTVAINVSAAQLIQAGFSSRMTDLARAAGVPPHRIVIEVSARALLDSEDLFSCGPSRAALQSLAGGGFRLAVDDVGTGHSSLTDIVSFPLDILKIDESCIAGLGRDRGRESVVAALVALARQAGMAVVAEGVEQELQLGALRSLDCTHAQGFYFSRPLPAAELAAELQGRAALGGPIRDRRA